MSVSGELLCSFELLKPLDSSALKSHIKKAKNKRATMLNSPVSQIEFCAQGHNTDDIIACFQLSSVTTIVTFCMGLWIYRWQNIASHAYYMRHNQRMAQRHLPIVNHHKSTMWEILRLCPSPETVIDVGAGLERALVIPPFNSNKQTAPRCSWKCNLLSFCNIMLDCNMARLFPMDRSWVSPYLL
jgi:hypothetical protein